MKLNKTILSVARIASDDETRSAIGVLKVECKGNELSAVSTDGRALIRARVHTEESGEVSGNIPKDVCKSIIKGLSKHSSAEVSFDGVGKCVITKRGKAFYSEFPIESSPFPQYQGILPDPKKMDASVTIAIKHFKNILNTLEAIGATQVTLDIKNPKPNSASYHGAEHFPIGIRAECGPFNDKTIIEGAVMPIAHKIDKSEKVLTPSQEK